jgi:hypothetical protein
MMSGVHAHPIARAPLLVVALTTIIVVECARVLFSVAYHAGESLGNLTSGLIVLALFAGDDPGATLPAFLLWPYHST